MTESERGRMITEHTDFRSARELKQFLAAKKRAGLECTQLSFNIRAGVLLWSKLRDAVNIERFNGFNIKMFEGSGWISRDFIVKGDPEPVLRVARFMEYLRDGQ